MFKKRLALGLFPIESSGKNAPGNNGVFPVSFFIITSLQILPNSISAHKGQLVLLNYQLPDDPTFLEHQLGTKRVVFY